MHHHAYIFDLDGTLVDSLQDIRDALNAALSAYRLPTASDQQVCEWVGDGLRALCRRACQHVDETYLEQVTRSAAEQYSRICVRTTRLYPNILRMLNLLANRNAPMAVLSNKPHALTMKVVRHLGIAPMFATINGLVREEERKPTPVAALRTATTLRVPPGEILIVGDSRVDIDTARNSGMQIAAVTWGFRPEDELRACCPDFLARDPLEIPEFEKK